jgi:hypothetical protein
VSSFLRWFIGLVAVSVILLPQPRRCCAAETTQRGVSAAVFGGVGGAEEDNNEGAPDVYQLHRLGGGLLGVLRGSSTDTQRNLGLFAQAGVTSELEWAKQTECGAFCAAGSSFTPGPYRAGQKLGWRLGVGYSFAAFEFRVGVLQVLRSQDSLFPQQLILPDVVARFGRRSVGWFELGLGAYDASTSLRPGIYLGGGGLPLEQLRLSGHVGLHRTQAADPSVGIGVFPVVELSADHAFSRSIIGGAGVMYDGAFEGNAHVAWLF